MIVGTTIFRLDGNLYYSPEFSRGGLAATFSVDVTHYSGPSGFAINIETRNSEDTTWTTLGTFASITATGHFAVDLTGCKELVRFGYGFDPSAASTDAVHILMQAPSWRPY